LYLLLLCVSRLILAAVLWSDMYPTQEDMFPPAALATSPESCVKAGEIVSSGVKRAQRMIERANVKLDSVDSGEAPP
jgi:hypothetical protein